MIHTRRATLALFALAAATPGCTVDRSPLEDRVFRCDTDDDCVSGYGCMAFAPYGDAACMPLADQGCDGVETADGFCIATCRVGDASGCAPGRSCVRGFILAGDLPPDLAPHVDQGYCLPVQTCDSSEDCTDAERSFCLADFVQSSEGDLWETDGRSLVCMPECTGGGDCPEGQLCGGSLGPTFPPLCLPRCGGDGSCPPLFSCYDVYDGIPTLGSVCLPGVLPFQPCRDPLGCLVGECLDALGGRFCSFHGCDRTADIGFACSSDVTIYFEENGQTGLSCDQTTDVCGGVLGVGMPCTTDAVGCAPELECHEFPEAIPVPPLCTHACETDLDCGTGLYCDFSNCLRRQASGEGCGRDAACVSGSCVENVCQ